MRTCCLICLIYVASIFTHFEWYLLRSIEGQMQSCKDEVINNSVLLLYYVNQMEFIGYRASVL